MTVCVRKRKKRKREKDETRKERQNDIGATVMSHRVNGCEIHLFLEISHRHTHTEYETCLGDGSVRWLRKQPAPDKSTRKELSSLLNFLRHND